MAKRPTTIALMFHHTAGNEKNAQQLRDVFKSKFNVGYVGYTVAIFPDGSFVQDLGWFDWGIHNDVGRINNSNSASISFVGDFSNKLPTEKALQTARAKAREFEETCKIKLRWQSTAFGHRDMKSTACPGDMLYKYLPEFIYSLNDDMSQQDRDDLNRLRRFEDTILKNKHREIGIGEKVFFMIHSPNEAFFLNDMKCKYENIIMLPEGFSDNPDNWKDFTSEQSQAEIKRLYTSEIMKDAVISELKGTVAWQDNKMDKLESEYLSIENMLGKVENELEICKSKVPVVEIPESPDHSEAKGTIAKILQYFISLISKK